MTTDDMRQPNILVTGTPGVGKSKLCSRLAEECNLKWQDVSAIAKENKFLENFDEEFECPVLDEDKILDHLEPIMSHGGNIVEYHGCDFFPERWFDVVYVVTCDNTILYDRLSKRNYNTKKIQSNIECEIFQTILDEAKESYEDDIIFEIKGDSENDLEGNVKSVKEWIEAFNKDEN